MSSDNHFDFSTPEARTKDTATLTVRHPTKGELPVRIEIAGRDSELYQQESKQYRKKALQSAREDQSTIDREANEILAKFLAAITVSWEGVSYDGEQMECTPENAYKLYADRSLRWLRDQVDDFATNRRNYLGN